MEKIPEEAKEEENKNISTATVRWKKREGAQGRCLDFPGKEIDGNKGIEISLGT